MRTVSSSDIVSGSSRLDGSGTSAFEMGPNCPDLTFSINRKVSFRVSGFGSMLSLVSIMLKDSALSINRLFYCLLDSQADFEGRLCLSEIRKCRLTCCPVGT